MVEERRQPELVQIGDPRQGQERPFLNLSSDPILWLSSRNIFRDHMAGLTEAQLKATRFADVYRLEIARRIQQLFEVGQVTAVRAIDYGVSVDSSARPGDASNEAIDAMRELGRVRDGIPRPAWELLARMLQDDVWPWVGLKKRQRARVYDRIRWSLDHVAVYRRYLRPEDFATRWPDDP